MAAFFGWPGGAAGTDTAVLLRGFSTVGGVKRRKTGREWGEGSRSLGVTGRPCRVLPG
ncbi:hypothetical protein SGFS_028690 [Streptomyces graminofaciens]|uniref:Uncharacterized protein n=1 Tax=Streptomyces graminofaciens TaxID=68212 RepID=A0ABN5VEV5_9ACTN|nr:hypothetical protein SGFS_028690 [Streptomyces graminofaciens]